ncbi:MAG: DUF1559 domain-containing protein [Gemmataceae bacterium]|nr:DUF1559 domain-containing protein [Gemmataceae bacterium]
MPPNQPACDAEEPGVLVLTNAGSAEAGRVPSNPLDHVEDANSRHTGGANFLFADGSARMITNGIRPAVWTALAARAGGEAYGASDF